MDLYQKAQTYSTPEWEYQSIKGIFKAILKLTYDVKSFGVENIEELDANKGFLLAANHGSIVDAFVMGLEIKSNRVRFVGRQKTLWSNPIFATINNAMGTIPVPESRIKDKSIVVKTTVNALKHGASVGIFPEGAILRRKKKFDGKSGAIRMALEAKVPVVPIGLLGTDGLWPYGAKMPRLGRPVEMFIGKPLNFDEFYGLQANKDVVNYLTDLLMKEIRRESGWYDVPAEVIIELHQRYENIKKPII